MSWLFPAAPFHTQGPAQKCTLTEEPFFLLLGIPPNRNFRPAIFFPFPFFFPSFELLIFFFTPGPGGTKDLLFHCSKSPWTASPDPVLARKWEKKLVPWNAGEGLQPANCNRAGNAKCCQKQESFHSKLTVLGTYPCLPWFLLS